MTRSAVFIILVLLAANVALADVYEWTDTGGVVHFTDNPESVPPRYRDRIRHRESISAQPLPSVAPQAVVQPTIPAPTAPELYGGQTFEWWQEQYRSLTKEIGAVKAEIDAARNELNMARRKKLIYQRGIDRAAVAEKQSILDAKEARLTELEKKLTDLEDEARQAEVPKRWNE